MGNRKVSADRANLLEKLLCLPVECHGRTSARNSCDLHILPGDAAAPAGADGLHSGLFGGEASGVALCLVRLRLAVADFVRSENPLQKSPPEALYGGGDPVDLCDVNAGSDDHG